MTGHEWKVLASFGLLLGGLSLYDPGFAVKIGGVALVVLLVKNADRLPLAGTASGSRARPSSTPESSTLHV